MNSDWQIVLVVALALNAVLGFGYRVHRLGKGGPIGDVWGQGVLGVLLLALALAVGLGAGWARWPAGIYAVVFGVIVMPLWLLAVFIPMRPGTVDYAFTGSYWLLLGVILLAAVLA